MFHTFGIGLLRQRHDGVVVVLLLEPLHVDHLRTGDANVESCRGGSDQVVSIVAILRVGVDYRHIRPLVLPGLGDIIKCVVRRLQHRPGVALPPPIHHHHHHHRRAHVTQASI